MINVGIELDKPYDSQTRTEVELQAFKDEMSDFRNEMREQNREMNLPESRSDRHLRQDRSLE